MAFCLSVCPTWTKATLKLFNLCLEQDVCHAVIFSSWRLCAMKTVYLSADWSATEGFYSVQRGKLVCGCEKNLLELQYWSCKLNIRGYFLMGDGVHSWWEAVSCLSEFHTFQPIQTYDGSDTGWSLLCFYVDMNFFQLTLWSCEATRRPVVPKELPQCCCCFLVARKFFSRAVTGRLDNKPVFSILRLSCDLTSQSTWCCKRWQRHQSPLNTGLDIVTGLSVQAWPWVKTLFLRLRYRPSDFICCGNVHLTSTHWSQWKMRC